MAKMFEPYEFIEVLARGADVPICFNRLLVSAVMMRKEDGGARIYLDAPELTGPCGFIDTPEDYRYVRARVTGESLEEKIREEKYRLDEKVDSITEKMYEGLGGKLSLKDIQKAVRAASNFEPGIVTHDIPNIIGRKKPSRIMVMIEGWGEMEQLTMNQVYEMIEYFGDGYECDFVVNAYPVDGGTVLDIKEHADDGEVYDADTFFVTLEDGPALALGLLATGIGGIRWTAYRGAEPVFFEDREDVNMYDWLRAA